MRKSKKQKSLSSGLSHKIAFWIKKRMNVLFIGKHGIGKTARILQGWKQAGIRFAYFSGATMDPFVDFAGVPAKVKGKDGKDYIELIRPKYLEELNVQAIFIDEFNRTHKKVRNAVMELLQFKTINGRPISKDLRMVWAAVNPDNDVNSENDYDTDRLDPAQRDRFHVQVNLPYECDLEFFKGKFGAKIAEPAVRFWNQLPEKAKDAVSPRRLEYALDLHVAGGDIRDALPVESNPAQLLAMLKFKGAGLDELLKKSSAKVSKFFANDNTFNMFADTVLKTKKYHKLVQHWEKEKIAAILGEKHGTRSRSLRKIITRGMGHTPEFKVFEPILQEISKVGGYAGYWANKTVNKFAKKKSAGAPTKKVRVPKGKSVRATFIRLLWGYGTSGVKTNLLLTQLRKQTGKHVSFSRLKNSLPAKAQVWAKAHGYKFTYDKAAGTMTLCQ